MENLWYCQSQWKVREFCFQFIVQTFSSRIWSKQQILSERHNLLIILDLLCIYIHVQASVMNIYITIFRLMALKSVKQLHLIWEVHVFCLFVSPTSVLLFFFFNFLLDSFLLPAAGMQWRTGWSGEASWSYSCSFSVSPSKCTKQGKLSLFFY